MRNEGRLRYLVSERALSSFEDRALTYLEQGRESLQIGLFDLFDQKEWTDPCPTIQFAIRASNATRLLVNFFCSSDTKNLKEYSTEIYKNISIREPEIAELELKTLSYLDLANLSSFWDSMSCLALMGTGSLCDGISLHSASEADHERLKRSDDSDARTVKEGEAIERIRSLAIGVCEESITGPRGRPSEHLKSGQTIFEAIAELALIVENVRSLGERQELVFGARTFFALVRMMWVESQMEGTFELSSDRMLLLCFGFCSSMGDYSGRVETLFDLLKPDQIARDFRELLRH